MLGTVPAAREGSTSIKLESLRDTALEAAWQVAMWQVEDIIEGNKKRMREVLLKCHWYEFQKGPIICTN